LLLCKGFAMKIPPYWTRESYTGRNKNDKAQTFIAYGWSLESLEAAKEDAVARAKRVFDYVINGKRLGAYEYGDRPRREEIIQTLRDRDRDIAVITRNRYGALVLNAVSVLFVDVDFPRIRAQGIWDAILLALSGSRRRRRAEAAREQVLESVRRWSRDNPSRSLRIYRTHAGLRLLFVDKLYEPKSPETRHLLQELGSDPLYRKLTEKQECFRARLTPKPWRCDISRPPNEYPWPDAQAEQEYRQWEEEYDRATQAYTVCRLLETCGSAASNAEIAMILDLHDKLACDMSKTELA
jgi:hypothetical protein